MRKQITDRVCRLTLAILAIVLAPSLAHGAVLFDLGENSRWGNFGPGIGPGTPANPQLDLSFGVDSGLSGLTKSLSTTPAGNTWTFDFGWIRLNEAIEPNETDGVSFTAYLDFVEPPGVGAVAGPATVEVKGGIDWFLIFPYIDTSDRLVVSFEPVTVNFGNGGQFELALSGGTLSDDRTPNKLHIDAKVTLLREPNSAIPSTPTVPEPATIGMWGLGALCLAATRFRRRK